MVSDYDGKNSEHFMLIIHASELVISCRLDRMLYEKYVAIYISSHKTINTPGLIEKSLRE